MGPLTSRAEIALPSAARATESTRKIPPQDKALYLLFDLDDYCLGVV